MRLFAAVLLLVSVDAFAAGGSSARLESLFDPAVINTPVSSLTARFGKPVLQEEGQRTYRVDGCTVDVRMRASGHVDSVAMDVTANCQVRLASVVNGLPALDTVTYGQLEERLDEGRFAADCLKLCGNAANPSVYQTWQLDAPNTPMELRAYTMLVSDKAIKASSAWSKGIERVRGADFVIDNEFSCDMASDTLAHVLFKDVRITRIELGLVPAERCAAN